MGRNKSLSEAHSKKRWYKKRSHRGRRKKTDIESRRGLKYALDARRRRKKKKKTRDLQGYSWVNLTERDKDVPSKARKGVTAS